MLRINTIFIAILACILLIGCGRTPGGLEGEYAMYALIQGREGVEEQRVDGMMLKIDGKGNYEMNGNPGHKGKIELNGDRVILSPAGPLVEGMGEGLPDQMELGVIERGSVLSMEMQVSTAPKVLWKKIQN